jgi:hypothetical protein
LQRFLVIRANLGNREAIDFAVDQILAAPSPVKGSDDAERRDYHGLGPSADVFLREARAAIGAGEGLRLEEIVARALRQSGVDVIAEHPGADRGVDLAIWSDPLQPLLGNPILIEIKSRIRTKDEARSALQHLSSAIASSGTQWGLLLYGEGPPNEGKLWTSAPPNVLVLSLATLFDRMRRQPFSEIMKTLRNRRVHGGYP